MPRPGDQAAREDAERGAQLGGVGALVGTQPVLAQPGGQRRRVAMTAAARNSAVASRPRPAGSTRLSTRPIAPPTPAAAAPSVGVREFAVSSSGPSTVRGSDALSADSRKRLIDRFTSAST